MVAKGWLVSLSIALTVLGKGAQDNQASSCRISETRMDMVLAVDGSGSVTPPEFAAARALGQGLAASLELGGERVRLALLQVGEAPVTELALGRGTSPQAVRSALSALRQRMGDTNAGRALSQLAGGGGWDPGDGQAPAPARVLLWLTDGYASDRLEEASGLLREAGIFTFVVTTGRRVAGLRQVATHPAQDFLFFTEPEEIALLAPRICRAIK
uniref:von Willebrand factor A domain-containing protein 1-like n=1 Tax=Pristiophorus japonicus TaxID=55135 RepID=UPI00398F400A